MIDKMKKCKFKWSCLALVFLVVVSAISYSQIRWCYYDSLMRALTVEDIAGVWELDNNNGEIKSKITFFVDGRFSYVNIPMENFSYGREVLESGSGKWTLDNSGEWDPCISIRSDISNTWVLMYMNYDGANGNALRLSVFYDEEKLFFKKLTKDGVD